MKKYFYLFFVFIVIGCTPPPTKLDAITYKAGIFESSGCIDQGIHGEHQVSRSSCEVINLVEETNKVKMRIGLTFGIDYWLATPQLKECYIETRVLEHPPMRQPNGTITTHYTRSYEVGRCVGDPEIVNSAFTWHIEKDWESVKGAWVFKVLIDDKLVIEQKFNAY